MKLFYFFLIKIYLKIKIKFDLANAQSIHSINNCQILNLINSNNVIQKYIFTLYILSTKSFPVAIIFL